MKTLRFIAGVLLVITGVIHIALFIKAPDNPDNIGLVVFGIIYLIAGVLLFTSKKYPLYPGLVLPLIGMSIYLIKFGFPTLISIMTLLLLIDVVVIISCGYLLLKKRES